ncbi:MAG: NAD(+)/NADH kinase [Firmicutes bacterium]|nr:NAD(+)/NADH kinase [Bacillota bacterium]
MKIGIYTNIQKDKDFTVTQKLAAQMQSAGFEVLHYGDSAAFLGKPDAFSSEEKPEIMLTLGGDGTILRIVAFCAERGIPIMGLNLGTIGFLTCLECTSFCRLPEIIKSRAYKIDPCFLLSVKFGGKEVRALNEAVVARQSGKLMSIKVHVNGEFVDNYYCDGFIVATPTGSTAYSLSAGGPIVSPLSDVILLTPVNPHTLHARPIVVNANDVVSVTPFGDTETCNLLADGNVVGLLGKGESVVIRKSTKPALFIKTDGEKFFSRLLNKLNIWSVTEVGEE